MKTKTSTGIGFFEKYLTLWVLLCMAAGVLIGRFLPAVPDFLGRFEYAQVSIPIAILIWLMIYPMMMKVDFASVRYIGKNPKGLYVTWVTNWLIRRKKPGTVDMMLLSATISSQISRNTIMAKKWSLSQWQSARLKNCLACKSSAMKVSTNEYMFL